MSPEGTKRLGDLKELPACAPEGLKSLLTIAEGVIHDQVELLGKSKPSQAPDLHKLLRDEGITKPEDQGTMIEKYSDHKTQVDKIKSDYKGKDKGIVVETAGIGKVVTDAYDAVETSVGELNTKIVAAQQSVITKKNEKGVEYQVLPKEMADGVFTAIWDTLNTTFDEVSGVSDQAAAAAHKIKDDEPAPPARQNTGGVQPISYNGSGNTGSGSSGSTPWSGNTTQIADAPIGSAKEKETAQAMMNYLITEHNFTPAQAAGIVANAKYESGFNVGATGDNGSAHGLFQWRFGRYDGLQQFASRPGEDINDWHTHLDYMVHELRNGSSYQTAENAINNNPNNAAAVAAAFDEHYERSAGLTIGQRQDKANEYLDDYNNAPKTDSTSVSA